MKEEWTVAEAKADLNEVIERALTSGPQTITQDGTRLVVIVSSEQWETKTRRTGSLAQFFASSPLRGSNLELARRIDQT